ncbi:unnamed protein product [Coregonus sp. 'balchen']|nr:unnamed protein product [Coregonus sp. 'balchen']
MCRGFVDSFLIRKQTLEVWRLFTDRVQENINRLIGSRQPLVEDRKNLPYADAVIHEIQRLANIAPMAILHTTSRDITFQGYFIKKGTLHFSFTPPPGVTEDDLDLTPAVGFRVWA